MFLVQGQFGERGESVRGKCSWGTLHNLSRCRRCCLNGLLCRSQLSEMCCGFSLVDNVPAGNLLPLQLSVSGPTIRMSLFVYRQVNLFRCLTLYPAALNCWDWHSLSLSIVHSAILPRALVGKRQGRYKPNKLLLSGGGRKTLRERKEQRKKRKEREREREKERERTTEGICIANPPGGKCWVLRVTTCWVTEGFVWSDSCVVGSVRFQCCQSSKQTGWFLSEGRGMFPPSAVILHRLPLCSNRSIRFTAGGTGQMWLCNSAAITRLTVSHNGLLLKAQFTQITQKKKPNL